MIEYLCVLLCKVHPIKVLRYTTYIVQLISQSTFFYLQTSIIYNHDSEASLFKDKSVIMGGSLHTLPESKIKIGDISALMLENTPWPGRPFLFPDIETLLNLPASTLLLPLPL